MEEQNIEQLTKRERKEFRREEKKEQQELIGRKRKVVKILWWSIGILAVIGAGYGLVILSRQGGIGKDTNALGQKFSDQGQQHIAVGATHPEYNSNPPTSGWHYAQSANWGVYQTELPDEQLIHNLEHGGIWISYKDIDDAAKTALEKIAESRSKVVVAPRAKNDAPIVLASWGRLQKFQTLDEQGILNFIKANSNKSPEPFAQ